MPSTELTIHKVEFIRVKPLWTEAHKELKSFAPYNANAVYFVGSIYNLDIGFVGVVLKGKYALNTNLFVRSLFRNKGYGASLIKHRVEYAKMFNCKYITANCTNKVAKFYTAIGGVIVRKFKNWTRIKLEL